MPSSVLKMTSPRVVMDGAKTKLKFPAAGSGSPRRALTAVLLPSPTTTPEMLGPPRNASYATWPRAFDEGLLKNVTYCPPAGAAAPDAAMMVCVVFACALVEQENCARI